MASSHLISCLQCSALQKCFLCQKVEISKRWCLHHHHQTAEGRNQLQKLIRLLLPSLLTFQKLDSRHVSNYLGISAVSFVHGNQTSPLLHLCCVVTQGCAADQFSVMTSDQTVHSLLWYDMWGTAEVYLQLQPDGLVLLVVQNHWNGLEP